jgi:maltooligosyltrehalose trehalohydrolase
MKTNSPAARSWFGATAERGGVTFRVWAPAAQRVSVVIESGSAFGEHRMSPEGDGGFSTHVATAAAGDRYRLRMDDGDPLPDPASRFQPDGVHGPSEIVDPGAFAWSDGAWRGIDPATAVFYELHVGTFTPEGTFAGAALKLRYLKDLGVTVVELMPLADFPGNRNWGYDGVSLFAPARCYGRPDDLRRFVDEAHRIGLAVHLDVVYNHLGPDGAYMRRFAPDYFTDRHPSPWGDGVNVDGDGSPMVRRYIIENALHWIAEYHVDGLRLDATHALRDDGPTPIVAALVDAVREHAPAHVMVVAEDHRNLAEMVRERRIGGWGLDGVWADDFHHIMRRILAGDEEGYYEDFRDSVGDLAVTVARGWFYTGQVSRHLGVCRGSDPRGVPLHKFVICLQNHDQIGNRAFGDRLSHRIDAARYRAATAVLLLAPETPLLFMGQEWAASTPFLYFTDHGPELGEQVVHGRRREFERFSDFRDPDMRKRIPSPQAADTFAASRLKWDEPSRSPHRGILALHKRLLQLRMGRRPWGSDADAGFCADALDADTILLRHPPWASSLWVVARLRGSGHVTLPAPPARASVVLTTEDAEFAGDARPEVDVQNGRIHFPHPAAVVFSLQP